MKKLSGTLYFIFSIVLLAIFAVVAVVAGSRHELFSLTPFRLVCLVTVLPVLISNISTGVILKKSDELFPVLPLLIISGIFEFLSLVLGTILIALPAFTGNGVSWYLWGIELIFVIIYLPVLLYFILGTNYIVGNRKAIKKKVFYIRDLVSKITIALPSVEDERLKSALVELSDDIRYSDPLSKNFVKDVEAEISETVEALIFRASDGASYEDCKSQLHKAKMLILQRNETIKNLK